MSDNDFHFPWAAPSFSVIVDEMRNDVQSQRARMCQHPETTDYADLAYGIAADGGGRNSYRLRLSEEKMFTGCGRGYVCGSAGTRELYVAGILSPRDCVEAWRMDNEPSIQMCFNGKWAGTLKPIDHEYKPSPWNLEPNEWYIQLPGDGGNGIIDVSSQNSSEGPYGDIEVGGYQGRLFIGRRRGSMHFLENMKRILTGIVTLTCPVMKTSDFVMPDPFPVELDRGTREAILIASLAFRLCVFEWDFDGGGDGGGGS